MKDDKPTVRPRLGRSQRESMLRHVLRLPELFEMAFARLEPSHLGATGDGDLSALWSAARQAAGRYGSGALPSDPSVAWAVLQGELEAMIASGDVFLLPPTVSGVLGSGGLLEAFYGHDEGLDVNWGRQLLVEFLRERTVLVPLHELLDSMPDHVPGRLDDLLSVFQDRDRALGSLTRPSARSGAPENYRPPDLQKSSSGVDFLDAVMNGGDAVGEVYGVLGAYGSGKTCLAVQATYEKALVFQAEHDARGGPLATTHLFHYEAGYDEILRRLWAYAARVHKDVFESFDPNALSTTGKLKSYELTTFARTIAEEGLANVPGERERLDKALTLIRRNVYLHDFSSPADDPGAGTGGVDEIAAKLRYEADRDMRIGAVYVDYVLAAARRQLAATGRRTEDLRHLINAFPDECMRKIAKPFGCRVYLFHQLSGAANARGFGARLDHSDSGECKTFAENLWFCFVLGARDLETNCLQLYVSKSRRARGVESPPLLRLVGQFGALELAGDMVLNASLGKPVSRQEMSMIAPVHFPSTPTAGGGGAYDLADYE